MYKKIVIILLLSGYASTQEDPATTAHKSPRLVSTEQPSFVIPGARQQIDHIFSEPEIIGIIYAVMLGVIVTVLSFALCIGQLTKKSSLPVPSSPPEDADSEVL
ncbi:glycophorin-A-like isoform X2 [Ursus americanus]|uniref:glycophorin-A-like isoform X2 n=1 Tax=Ursus americanus TaxID=9643 RepID=UPI001E67C651|nr:glycophorin-A-like isoform X2 [Ursus americanus]